MISIVHEISGKVVVSLFPSMHAGIMCGVLFVAYGYNVQDEEEEEGREEEKKIEESSLCLL
jgi:putative Ca2+/H+ antiporter (TMEM165/GDT1 family)